jgi:uncharacterized repeat protein (TIGR03803 family)
MKHPQLAQSGPALKSPIARQQCKAAARLLAMATLCLISAQVALSEFALQQLQKFSAFSPKPKFPFCKLAEGPAGSFYGTTTFGGDHDLGTVFKLTHTGELTPLHSFDGTDGRRPFGGLVLAADGNFYGTTTGFGFADFGTVFRINSSGTFTPVAIFGGTNGAGPRGPLIEGNDGCLYGVTQEGGTFDLGTVFKVTTNGALTSLFSFNGTNGSFPRTSLARGNDGTFYGATPYGGSNFTGQATDHGTTFKITTNGVLTTLVYFNGTNGLQPNGSLALGNDGNFYGTTQAGGAFGKGTVFRMTTGGGLNVLASFDGTNGAAPFAGVTPGADGKFYGVAPYGTANPNANYGSVGTVYSITANGGLTVVARFDGTNAQNPFAEFTLARDGNLYAVTGDIALNLALDGNSGIFFRLAQVPLITSLARTASDDAWLTWTSFTNGIYRVEYKPSLTAANWTPLDPEITATGSITSYTNAATGELQGFYRVRLLP